MKSINIPLEKRFKSESLIYDYLTEKEYLKDFVYGFQSWETLSQRLNSRKFESSKRKVLVDHLKLQYAQISLNETVSENIESLLKDNSFTVVTGHQICLATGPLYFIYKILSTIKLARDLANRHPEKKIVPVYWMATEDHDFEEVNHFNLFNKKLEWNTDQKGAVGEMKIDQGFEDLRNQLTKILGDSEEDNNFIKLFNESYQSGDLFAFSTLKLVNHLFEDYGLVILDSNSKELKSLFKSVVRTEVLEQRAYHSIKAKLDGLPSVQVNPRESNLFYLDKGVRDRIDFEGEYFVLQDSKKKITKEEMLELIDSHPEKISPNVILRPLYQERILPNVAYVGGPGELAYWLELKPMFDSYEEDFPLLVLRESHFIVDYRTADKMEQFDLDPLDYFNDFDQLAKQLVENSDQSIDLSPLADKWTHDLKAFLPEVEKIDKTLVNSFNSEMQKVEKSIQNLQGKLIRSLKRNQENRISQISKIQNVILPNGAHQDRVTNCFQYLSQNQTDVIEWLDSVDFEFNYAKMLFV